MSRCACGKRMDWHSTQCLDCYRSGGHGFARLPLRERQRMARIGGTAAQAWGVGHRWGDDDASREAGRRGGLASAAKRKSSAGEGVA